MIGERLRVVAGIAGVVLVAAVRSFILGSGPGPATIDTGNWLAYAEDILGTGVRSGLAYPPLVPLLSRVAVDTFGPVAGVAVLGFLASVLPGLAVFVLLARVGAPGLGGVAGAVAAAAAALGEVVAWGGFPQAIALGGAILCIAGLTGWLVEGGGAYALIGIMGWVIATWSSHLVALPLATATLVLVGFVVAARPNRAILARAASAAIAGLLVALPVIPVYLALAADLATAGGVRRLAPSDLERVLGGLWPGWLVALAAGPLAAAVLVRRRARGGERGRLEQAVLGVAVLAVGWSSVLLATGQVRYAHDVAVLAPLGLGLASVSLGWERPRRPVGVPIVALGAVLIAAGLLAFPSQVERYRVASADTVAAVEWVRDATPAGAVVAVPDVGGAPLGWWVEGLGRRPTVFASDLRWLVFRDERSRAAVAGRLFYGSSFASPATADGARAAGVDFILLPDRAPWANLGAGPLPPGWVVRFRSGEAVVLGTAAGPVR